MSSLTDELTAAVEPALKAQGLELVDLTYQREPPGWVLRVFIDKPGGITLQDCQDWSDRIGSLLDEKNLPSESYVLEVSSPGINRPLKKPKDFQRFTGEKVQVRLFDPIEGRRQFNGTLRGLQGDSVLVELPEGGTQALPIARIAKARLDRDIHV